MKPWSDSNSPAWGQGTNHRVFTQPVKQSCSKLRTNTWFLSPGTNSCPLFAEMLRGEDELSKRCVKLQQLLFSLSSNCSCGLRTAASQRHERIITATHALSWWELLGHEDNLRTNWDTRTNCSCSLQDVHAAAAEKYI